jgi:hypothetical protein
MSICSNFQDAAKSNVQHGSSWHGLISQIILDLASTPAHANPLLLAPLIHLRAYAPGPKSQPCKRLTGFLTVCWRKPSNTLLLVAA